MPRAFKRSGVDIMSEPDTSHKIYLEIGERRVFAGAIEWPGWCRSGRNEDSAVQTLVEYAPRYVEVLQSSGLAFDIPSGPESFKIVERLPGDSTTDFGAPGGIPTVDNQPIDAQEMDRLQKVLAACWAAFDRAAAEAQGKELTKGPRGGGRELSAIQDHVLGADVAYLKRISWRAKEDEGASTQERLREVRRQIFEGLEAAASGDLPTVGPRGGKRWPPRYFVRRVAWHVLDHAWEIEDRIQ
jgi:hypothetical protein